MTSFDRNRLICDWIQRSLRAGSWSGAPNTFPLQRTFVLRPFQRLPINLNDWPEFAGFIGGVSVSVSAKGRGMAAVVMHSADGSPPIILSGR